MKQKGIKQTDEQIKLNIINFYKGYPLANDNIIEFIEAIVFEREIISQSFLLIQMLLEIDI